MRDPEFSAAESTETANIHLDLEGQQRTFPVTFRPGNQTVGDLLPIARDLTHQVTAMAIESTQRQGRSISCRAGCGACCRQLVAISLVEAKSLAAVVAAMPPERQSIIRRRFAEVVRRLEEAGLLDPSEPKGSRWLISRSKSRHEVAVRSVAANYFQQQIACPFLENESCSIYADRPLVCREYHVSSPAADCGRLYEIGVERVEVAVHMSEVMTRVAEKIAGASREAIPLVLSLEWAEAHPGALAKRADSLEMLQTLMSEIDRDCAKGFDQRGEAANAT